MRIAVGTLFLAFAVFLDSIEISSGMQPNTRSSLENVGRSNKNANREGMSSGIPPRRVTYLHDVETSSEHANDQELGSSTLRTLEQLFPGYNGVLPRLETFHTQKTAKFHNFRRLGDRQMVDPRPRFFLVRDYVIIGWLNKNFVAPLCTCFHIYDQLVVFDMIKDRWYTLHQDEFQKLGTGRLVSFVIARDEIAALHRPTSTMQIDQLAHLAACEHANREADRIENEPDENLPRLRRDELWFERRIEEIKRGYSDTYRNASDTYKSIHEPNQTGM